MPKPAAVPDSILQRKGSPNTAGVPAEVRQLLNEGRIETVNLSEWLIVDQAQLAERVFRAQGWSALIKPTRSALEALKIQTAPKKLECIGRLLAEAFPSGNELTTAYEALRTHPSDIVRSWAGYLFGLNPKLTLAKKLKLVRPLAADGNMGVRETAWFCVRDHIALELPEAFRLLLPWTADEDARIRRFASESTRPRGVWCRHIQALKEDPTPGLPILQPLNSDSSKYVRDSVANWLNDASKSHPAWVRDVCVRWEKESPTPETRAIVKRALRTLRKAEK